MSNSIISLYIPRMSSFITEDMIKKELSFIGNIKRVDFTPVNKKVGFVENVNEPMKSAFVHFYFMLNHYKTYFNSGESFRHYLQFGSEYWILLKANNPVQDTMMNNAQIVENCRLLEKKVEEQATTIESLEKKVEGIQNVVYQLLGGLFNQYNQGPALENYLRVLFPENKFNYSQENTETSEWNNWPTTRQGDNNELRIADLESQIRELQQQNFYGEEDNENDNEELEDGMLHLIKQISQMKIDEDDILTVSSSSTHSSMPDLIEVDSDGDTIPDLESISSLELSERLRNSFELCGNE